MTITDKNTKPLTATQQRILRSGADNGRLEAGRYGWSRSQVRALAARGLATLIAQGPWDESYRLTEEGRRLANESKAAYRAAHP